MKSPTAGKFLFTTDSFTMVTLAVLDIAGALVIFNVNHWLITGELASDFLLTWKLILVIVVSLLCNYLIDLYTFDSPLSQLGMLERSFIAVLMTGTAVAIIVYVIGPEFTGGFVGRGVLATGLIMLWLWSLSIRYLLNNWFRHQRSRVRWVVLTHGDISRFIRDFRSVYQVEGLLLLTPPSDPPRRFDDHAIELLGDWNDLEHTMHCHRTSGIIVVSPEQMPEELIERLMKVRISGVRIFTLNDFYETHLARLPVFHLNQQWITMAHGFELIHNPIGLRFKRYIDITFALVVGLVVLPIIVVLALAVLVTSGTPVLYRQQRTGENDRVFTVYKLRTMVADAESGRDAYTAEDDPRVTPLGRIMRRFHLDELPQLWNVLLGDMSLIGPRPERPELISQLQKEIPYYNLRHIIPPGITGWAQVMYGYGENTADAAEKLQYDLFYIKNYSLLLDISILIRSLKVILFGAGR